MELETIEESGGVRPVTCVHGRLIEDVVVNHRKQKRTVRCLECGTIFDDPHGQVEPDRH